MLFTRINRRDPEEIFMIVKAGENLLANHPACFHFSGVDDGLNAFLCDEITDNVYTVGIADGDINAGNYGLVQVYGFRSKTFTKEDKSVPVNSGGYYNVNPDFNGHLSLEVETSGSTAFIPAFVSAHDVTLLKTSSPRLTGVLIRCM